MTTASDRRHRPVEVANILNPSFISVLLNSVCSGYKKETSQDLPYTLAFICIPLLIFPDYNKLIPSTSRSKLHVWVNSNHEIFFDFSERAKSLAPFVRESIAFGIKNKVLNIHENGSLESTKLNKSLQNKLLNDYISTAITLGKLFAQIPDTTTIYSIFGVRP